VAREFLPTRVGRSRDDDLGSERRDPRDDLRENGSSLHPRKELVAPESSGNPAGENDDGERIGPPL